MKILYLDPALPETTSGNNSTSSRIAEHWRDLGHAVTSLSVRGELPENDAQVRKQITESDLLVALHAKHCHSILKIWHDLHKPVPLILIVSGTDLFEPLLESGEVSNEFRWACEEASRIVTLAGGLEEFFPASRQQEWGTKSRVIYQGAKPVEWSCQEYDPQQAVVIGHLRAVKDPLLPVRAIEILRERLSRDQAAVKDVQLTIRHFGKLLDLTLEEKVEAAQEQLASGPLRWQWNGPVSETGIRQVMSSAPLLIMPSLHEGGANVVGEFLVSGLPIVASRVAGNTGILGEDWPALFDAGDSRALADLLLLWNQDEGFREQVYQAARNLAGQHDLRCERQRWGDLFEELGDSRTGN